MNTELDDLIESQKEGLPPEKLTGWRIPQNHGPDGGLVDATPASNMAIFYPFLVSICSISGVLIGRCQVDIRGCCCCCCVL